MSENNENQFHYENVLRNVLEIGCAPGGIRPGDVLKQVIEGTCLEDKKPASTFFDDWTWYYDEISPEDFKKSIKIIMPKLKELYNKGVIRYGHMSREEVLTRIEDN